MSRWLFVLVCVLAFSLPAAMLCLMVWPLYAGRPVPAALDQDALAIASASLVVSLGITWMLVVRLQA